MTSRTHLQSLRPSAGKSVRFLVNILLCAFAGAAVGAAFALWAPGSITDFLDDLIAREAVGYGWVDALALVVAAWLIGGGAFVALLSIRPKWMRRELKLDSPPTAPERGDMALSSLAMILAGVLYIIPLAAGPAGWSSWAAYGGVLLVLAVQTFVNWRLLQRADELARRVMMEAAALCFWGLQGLLFLYAAAERMAMVAPLTAWTATVILMPVYLAASMWAYARRGVT